MNTALLHAFAAQVDVPTERDSPIIGPDVTDCARAQCTVLSVSFIVQSFTRCPVQLLPGHVPGTPSFAGYDARQYTQLYLSFGKDPCSCATRMPRAPMTASR